LVHLGPLDPESQPPAGFTPKDELNSCQTSDPFTNDLGLTQDLRAVQVQFQGVDAAVVQAAEDTAKAAQEAAKAAEDAAQATAQAAQQSAEAASELPSTAETAAALANEEAAISACEGDLVPCLQPVPVTHLDTFDWKDLALNVPVTFKDTYAISPDNFTETEQPDQLAQEQRQLHSEKIGEEEKK
jgi:hypothetical protein